MKSFFKDPALYTSLAILTIFIGLLLSFIASGLADTYFPDDPIQLVIMIGFVMVPALLIAGGLFYISRRLKRVENTRVK